MAAYGGIWRHMAAYVVYLLPFDFEAISLIMPEVRAKVNLAQMVRRHPKDIVVFSIHCINLTLTRNVDQIE